MKTLFSIVFRLLGRTLRPGFAVFGFLALTYFVLFALEGDRGYASLQITQREVVDAESRLALVQAERESIERKVVSLRPTSIDGDLLDEKVRETLGFVQSGDIVVLGH